MINSGVTEIVPKPLLCGTGTGQGDEGRGTYLLKWMGDGVGTGGNVKVHGVCVYIEMSCYSCNSGKNESVYNPENFTAYA